MKKATKIILKSVSTLIVALIVVFAFLLVGVRIFDVQIYSVLSGSMEPTYKVGSVIYVKDVNIQEDEMGNKLFQTKGDANDKVDERLVKESEIIGKPIFTIPYLGYIAHFMQTKHGMVTTIGIAIALIIIVMAIDMITDDKKNKKEIEEA